MRIVPKKRPLLLGAFFRIFLHLKIQIIDPISQHLLYRK